MNTVNQLKTSYLKKYGYSISDYELKSLYTSGSLILSDSLENSLLNYFNTKNI
jgi:hypothetical protein